jgi:hypothetical protein
LANKKRNAFSYQLVIIVECEQHFFNEENDKLESRYNNYFLNFVCIYTFFFISKLVSIIALFSHYSWINIFSYQSVENERKSKTESIVISWKYFHATPKSILQTAQQIRIHSECNFEFSILTLTHCEKWMKWMDKLLQLLSTFYPQIIDESIEAKRQISAL